MTLFDIFRSFSAVLLTFLYRKYPLVQYSEKRAEARVSQKLPVLVEDLKEGFVYRARMINYSGNGMYLETDADLDKGDKIFIGLEDSPFISSSRFYKGYLAGIVRQKQTEKAIYNFGYGVKIISAYHDKNIPDMGSYNGKDSRKHPRKLYSKPVFFSSKDRFYKGIITNISRGGMFIKTKDSFATGQIIILIIPGTKIDKGIKLKGKVVRFDNAGVGVKFIALLKKDLKAKPFK